MESEKPYPRVTNDYIYIYILYIYIIIENIKLETYTYIRTKETNPKNYKPLHRPTHFDIYIYIYIYIHIYIKMSRSVKRFVIFRICFFRSYVRICFQFNVFVREQIWHKALLMGYSMRLELICVCSLNDFPIVMGSYRGHSSLRLCLP